ncbi:MAG: aldose 1-epimerase family protein [Anaerolineae bacterium]
MPTLYGQEWSRSDIQQYVSNIDQIASVRPAVLRGGRAEGVEVVEFATGSGFQFTVVPGRGMDISHASYNGIPLCWRSYTGDVAASYFEAEGMGWLRGSFGGLMSTGGLNYMGAPSLDEGTELGIHGRANYLPASHVWSDAEWDGDCYRMWARGKVAEAASLGPNLVLTREISTELGAHHLVIRDTVENCTFERVEHMMLYHFNFGFPVLSDCSRIVARSLEVTPRDPDSLPGLEHWDRFEPPMAGRPHQLFYHRLQPDDQGKAHVMLLGMQTFNREPIAVYLSYTHETLPWLINWKCMQAGNYVTGIEPANAWVQGRAEERSAGRLQFLDAWQKVSYEVEFGVLPNRAAIEAFAENHQLRLP